MLLQLRAGSGRSSRTTNYHDSKPPPPVVSICAATKEEGEIGRESIAGHRVRSRRTVGANCSRQPLLLLREAAPMLVHAVDLNPSSPPALCEAREGLPPLLIEERGQVGRRYARESP
jgi:hypothetical protein